jgi:predicted TPR repeat methyltransferase
MSTPLRSLKPGLSALVRHLGLTPRHALAARRQAERDEAAQAFDAAAKNWALALTIEPSPAAWSGIVRCLEASEYARKGGEGRPNRISHRRGTPS